MNTIDLKGDDQTFREIVSRTIDSFIDDVLTSVGECAFYGCTSLTTVDFSAATSIGSSAFFNCTALTTLILRNTSQVATLSSTNAFSSANNAIIYVPDALVDSYKAANKWSTYASRIKGLSELPA